MWMIYGNEYTTFHSEVHRWTIFLPEVVVRSGAKIRLEDYARPRLARKGKLYVPKNTYQVLVF